MNSFVNFIRFYLLGDQNKEWNRNGQLPTTKHGVLPAVPGDVLRFLVPQSDLGGRQPESVRVRLLDTETGQLVPGEVGQLRRQDAEAYSEIKVRVNAGVADGTYKQFALLADVPNPNYQPVNLALGRTAEVSSSYETSTIGLFALTDGEIGPFWSSDGDATAQHDEFIVLPLVERSILTSLQLSPRYLPDKTSYFYPVDMRLEVSTDGGETYQFVRDWVGLDAPEGGKPVDYPLPTGTEATHIRLSFPFLRFNPNENSYRVQFSELAVFGNPANAPKTIPVNLLGTFRGQQVSTADYIQAIRSFCEAYPYTPVTVDQDGNELTIRIYHSGRFQLGNALVRVGIGQVTEQNENQPLLTVRKKDPVTVPAKTRYRVSVGADIESGNVFALNGVSYTATGSETPTDVLAALGLSGGTIEVAGGTAPMVSALPGSYTQANTNRPGINLLYDSTSGSTDYYKAIISGTVQAGNLYQVSCEGLTTRTKQAIGTDTATDITSFFNNVTGTKFAVPIGKVPVGSVSAGVQTIANTNAPTLSLVGRQEIAAVTMDCWSVFIGSSIRAGNRYSLGIGGKQTVIVAGADDTVLSLAAKFGYAEHPFVIGVPVGASVTALAEPGPRYREPDHLADVEVLDSPVRYVNLPWVAEVVLPETLAYHLHSIVLMSMVKVSAIIAQSNHLSIRASTRETMLMRFSDRGQVYGFHYQEAGLVQQLRLPGDLSAAKHLEEQALGKSLDNRTVRGLTRLETVRTLTTNLQPEVFHRALWAALKHRSVSLNGVELESRSNYQLSEPTPRYRLMQAQVDLTETDTALANGNDYKPLSGYSESSGYVLIRSIVIAEGLPVYLQTGNIVSQIRPGMRLQPGVYKLLVRPGREILEAVAYTNSLKVLRSILTPIVLNRVDQDLILLAGSVVDIITRPAPTKHPTMSAYQEHSAETAFSVEYESTYFQ